MGIEAPRFDFQSLNAPGGIGQGLGALSSALIDAQGRRRQNEMDQARLDFEKQGLARLQANDLANRSQQAMQFQEGVNSHRADEEYRTGQLKRQDGLAALADTRYKEGEKRQVVQDRLAAEERTYQHGRTDKIDVANIGKNNAEAEHYRKMVPSVPADHTKLTPATYAQLSQIAQKRAQARVDAEMFDPQYIKDKANAGHKDYYNPWNTPAPTASTATRQLCPCSRSQMFPLNVIKCAALKTR